MPTQIIAEFFRHHELDGIVYRSGLGQGKNVALFDLEAARPLNGLLFSPRSVKFEFEEISNPYFIKEEKTPGVDAGGRDPETA